MISKKKTAQKFQIQRRYFNMGKILYHSIQNVILNHNDDPIIFLEKSTEKLLVSKLTVCLFWANLTNVKRVMVRHHIEETKASLSWSAPAHEPAHCPVNTTGYLMLRRLCMNDDGKSLDFFHSTHHVITQSNHYSVSTREHWQLWHVLFRTYCILGAENKFKGCLGKQLNLTNILLSDSFF